MNKITLNLGLNDCPSVDETINVIRYINLMTSSMQSYRVASIELHESSYNGEIERCLVVDVFAELLNPVYTHYKRILSSIAEAMNQDCISYAVYDRGDLNSPWEFQHGDLVWNDGKNITDKMNFDLAYFKETVGWLTKSNNVLQNLPIN